MKLILLIMLVSFSVIADGEKSLLSDEELMARRDYAFQKMEAEFLRFDRQCYQRNLAQYTDAEEDLPALKAKENKALVEFSVSYEWWHALTYELQFREALKGPIKEHSQQGGGTSAPVLIPCFCL